MGDISPEEKFLISDLLRSLLVPFWGETTGVGQSTANLVIVFETFNSLTTVGYLLDVFIKLWIPSMLRIFTSTWS